MKSMSFGEKIGLVYENCEVLRYKIGRMEEYLGIKKEFLLVLLGKKKIFWKDIFLANFGTN